MTIVVDSSGLGNSQLTSPNVSAKPKQVPSRKNHFFTYNNYESLEEIVAIVARLKQFAYKGRIQTEVGEKTGTPHLQGMIWCKEPHRDTEFKLSKKIHWSSIKDIEDTACYCGKDDTHDGLYRTSWGFPTPVITIKREQFYSWQHEMVEIFEKPCEWDCRKIYWRYGATNIGKTQFAKWLCHHLGAVVIGGQARHMLAQVQKQIAPIYIVLLSYGDEKVSYRAIEQIKDGLFTSHFGTDNNAMEIRNAPHILIIGNEPPDKDDRHFHVGKYNVKVIDFNEEDEEAYAVAHS